MDLEQGEHFLNADNFPEMGGKFIINHGKDHLILQIYLKKQLILLS